MNKSDLVSAVAVATGHPKTVVAAVVDAALSSVSGALVADEPVRLSGFGTFENRTRAARTARNPRTGAAVPVAARRAPTFRPSPALRRAVERS